MLNRKTLEKEINEYCRLNSIDNVEQFITRCLMSGFNIVRYGVSPGDNIKREKGVSDEPEKEDSVEKKTVVRRKKKIEVKRVGDD